MSRTDHEGCSYSLVTISNPTTTMTNPTDWRALSSRLLAALKTWSPAGGGPLEGAEEQHEAALIAEADAALAQPEPEGPTPIDYRRWHEAHSEDCNTWSEQPAPPLTLRATVEALAWANHCLTRYARPTIQPVPVAERLPGPSDCIRRGDDDWCWGQERSLLTGQAAARWRLMRVSSLADEAMAWAPHWALPVSQQEGSDA